MPDIFDELVAQKPDSREDVFDELTKSSPAFFNPPPERPRLPAPELESYKGLARLGGVGSAIEKAQMLPGRIVYGAADLLDVGPKIQNFVREKVFNKPPEPPKQTLPQAWLKYYSDREKQLSKEDAALGINDVPGQLTEGVTRAAFELPVQIAAGAGAATEAAAIKAVAAGQGIIAGLTQYGQERGEGKGRLDSAAYGAASGLITGLTTKAFGTTGIESIFRKEGVKGIWNRVLSAAKDAGFEGLEESADQVQQDLLERITRNPDKPIADTVHDVLLAGSVGTIIGGAVSGVSQAARRQPPSGGTPAFFTPPPPIATPESMRPEADAATDRVTAAVSDRKQIAGNDARLAGARDRLPQMGYAYNEADDVFIPVRQVAPTTKSDSISNRLVVEPPAPAKPELPINQFAKEIGFTVQGLNQGAAVAVPKPEQLAAMSPKERGMYAEISKQQGNQYDLTDTRENSPTKGLTFYVPENATPEQMKALFDAKIAQESASQESKEKATAAARIAKTTVPPPVVPETPVPVKSEVMTFDEYSASNGTSSTPPSFPEYQRTPGGVTKPGARAASTRVSKALADWQSARDQLRSEYDSKLASGEIREPTRRESLEKKASGEGEAAEAARRLLAKLPETQPVLKSIREQASEFNQIIYDNADEQRWVRGQTLDDLHLIDPGTSNLGTMGIRGSIKRRQAMKIAQVNVAKALGLDPGQIGSEKYRSENLPKLQEFIAQKKNFQEATKDEGDSSGKIGVEIEDVKVGDTLTVDGEPVRVANSNKDFVVLEDGRKFGRQEVGKGETIYVEGYEPKVEPTAPVPKLGAMEKGTGDLLKGQVEDFALVGEKATDADRVAKEKADKEVAAKAAKEFEAKNQPDLLTEEKPNEEAKEESKVLTGPFADGSKVRVGNNPQTHTIVRETTDPKFPDERIFEVQNDKTGDKSEIDQKSLTPIKERTAEERAKGKKTGKAELDALLKDAGLDPSVFPDAKSKKNALERADAKLAEIQKKIRGGKTFTGTLGVEPLILDAAITAARGVLRATNSVLQAIQAAIDYIRTNQAGVELNEDDARNYFARELAGGDTAVEPQEPETETAEPPATPPPTNPAPPTAPPSDPENQLEFGTIVDPATGQRVPNTEGDQEIVQIAGITYNIIGKERLTPEQKAAADTKVREYFEKELNLPGEPDLSQGRRRGSTDLNIVFTITPDGENHDAAGERLVAHLTEEIQKQHQPGGDPAYVSSLVNAINKNFNVGNLNGVFGDDMITRLMNVSASESSWRGTMLRAITGITEDMGTVARNAKFFLRRTHENMFGGDLVRKIMDRIANNFREVFMSGDEIERLYNSNPILQEMFLKVVNRLKVKPSLREVIQEIFNTRIDKQDDIVEKFVDTMVNKFSATPEEAAKLKAEFGKTFVESFKAARTKAQEKALQTLLPEERQAIGIQTPLWKKLTDLVNSGWFDSAKVVEEYAQSKGMVIPTEAELERMRQWSIQEQSLREPTFEEVQAADKDEAKALAKVSAATLEKRQELLRKMNTQWSRWTHPIIRRKAFLQDFADPQKRYNTAMAANEWLAANLLLKIGFGTRQIFDIATQMVLHTPTRAVQYAFEQHANDKSAGRDSNLLHNISQSMTDAYRTRIKVLGDALASFKRTLAGKGEQKNVEQLISSIAVFDRALLRAEEMKMEGKPAAARFLQVLALMMRFGRQFAAAADVIQGVPAEAQEIAHQIRTGLREQGKGQAQQDLEFNNILGLLTTARQESINEARQILEARGLDTSKASVQRAAWHILREKIYQMAKTAGLPADEWKVQNHYFRNVIGWNEPESQGFGGIGGLGGLVAMTARGGKEVMSKLGIPAFPFVFGNAMGISLNRKLAYTPLGFFSGFFKGSPWFEGERMIRQRKIEATIGTTIGSTLFTLVALGILRVLPSFWPRDDKERAEWVAKGWQPGQVIVPWGEGQEWAIGTRVGPLGLVAPYLAAGGAFRKAIEDRAKKQEQLNQQAAKLGLEPEQLEGLDPAQWAAIVFAAGWASATGGRTASGMIGSYTDFGNPSIKKSSASAVSTLVPGLPAYQEIARMNGVSINPKLASFWDLVVPMETSDANRVNILGDPMRNENDVERIFKVLSGGTSPFPKDSDEFKQNKAYVNLFDSDFRPPSINPQRGYQFGNELRPMTQPELQRYTVARGKNFASELQAIDVNGLVPEEAKKVVQQAFKRANVKALEEVGVTGNAITPPKETAPPRTTRPSSRSSFRSSFGRSRGTRSSLASYRQPRLRSSRRRGRRISTGFRRTRRNRIRRTYSVK